MYRRTILITTTVLFLFLLPLHAAAHPHVFAYTGLQIVFDEKGLAGVRLLWIFDEMFSNMIISEYDQNGNRQFETAEVDAVKKGAFSNLKEFNYFTHIQIGESEFEVAYVTEFTARIKQNKLIYEFFVPCHVAAVDNFKEVTLSIYDHTYYCQIFLPKQAVAYNNTEPYEIFHQIEANPQKAYYFGQINPEEITLRFKRKSD